MHPELLETLITIGCRDVELLNSGNGVMVLRQPYADLDEPAELVALFEGKLGTADKPICGVMVLPPISDGEPPPRIPLSAMEFEKWAVVFDCYQDAQDESPDKS